MKRALLRRLDKLQYGSLRVQNLIQRLKTMSHDELDHMLTCTMGEQHADMPMFDLTTLSIRELECLMFYYKEQRIVSQELLEQADQEFRAHRGCPKESIKDSVERVIKK